MTPCAGTLHPTRQDQLLLQLHWRNSSLFLTGTQNKWPHVTQKSLLLPSTAPTASAPPKLHYPCCLFTASNFSPSFLLADSLLQTTQLSLCHEPSPALQTLSQDRAPSWLCRTPWNTKFFRITSLEFSSTHRYIWFFKLSKWNPNEQEWPSKGLTAYKPIYSKTTPKNCLTTETPTPRHMESFYQLVPDQRACSYTTK